MLLTYSRGFKLSFIVFLLGVILVGCGGETSLGRWLSVDYWRDPHAVNAAISQAKAAAARGETAYAIGKLKKAYGADPSRVALPLEIAGLYADIVGKNAKASFEREEGVRWLYRARLVYPSFSAQTLRQTRFKPLASSENFKNLLQVTLSAEGGDDARGLKQALAHIRGSLAEIQTLAQQVGRVGVSLYRLADWLGFQVMAFLGIVLIISFLLRLIGFELGKVLLFISFVASGIIWHVGIRVATAGEETGFAPLLKIMVLGGALVLGLWLIKCAGRWLGLRLQTQFKRTQLYRRLSHRSWQAKAKDSPSLEQFIFNVESAQSQLIHLGHQYLTAQDESKRQSLAGEIDRLRQGIHELTQESSMAGRS